MKPEKSTGSAEFDAVVVGGGIAGLSSAYFLLKLAPRSRLALIERDHALGGKIKTEYCDGFTIEGGPESFLTTKPGAVGLCRELGLISELRGPDSARQRTFVMRNGRLLRMPQGLSGLIPARLGPIFRSPLLSPAGKLRLALELVIPTAVGSQEESLASFVIRRFGSEAYDRLVEALMAGIYAGDGRQLSLDATFPQLRAIERAHGSVIRGIAKTRPTSQREDSLEQLPVFVTPTGGMSDLVRALLDQLEVVDVQVGSWAKEMTRDGQMFMLAVGGRTLRAKSVILATPAYETARLLDQVSPAAAAILRTIPHVSTATVSLGYRRRDVPHPLDGYGYIIPRVEKRDVLACTWMSSKYPDRAPKSQVLLRAFVGRAGQEHVLNRSDSELVNMVRQELVQTLGIQAAPTLQRIFRWPDAMPQPTLGHQGRMAALREELSLTPGVYLAGNAYQGIGIPDTIDTASAAAEAADHYIYDTALAPAHKVPTPAPKA